MYLCANLVCRYYYTSTLLVIETWFLSNKYRNIYLRKNKVVNVTWINRIFLILTKKFPYKSLFQFDSENPNFGYPTHSIRVREVEFTVCTWNIQFESEKPKLRVPETPLLGICTTQNPLGSKRMQPRKKHFCSGNKSQANVFAGQGKKGFF